MKNWKYINGAECVKIGNYGVSLDSAGARQVREMAAKLWTSGMHNSRDIAMAIAFEIAKTSKAMQENKADVVSNIQDMVDRWIKEVKTGNKMVKYTSKADSKKEFLYDEETGDLEVWYDGKKVDSLKNAGKGWEKYIETHATKTGNDTLAEYAKRPPKIVGGNSLPEELEKDVEKKDEEKIEDIEDLKKTGNETYQHKLYPDKYVIIQGKNYKIVTDGKVEKSGYLTDAVLLCINQVYKKVGNSDPKEEYWKRQYIEAARKKGVPEREIQEFIKKIEKEGAKGVMIPVKNSASEYEILKQDPSKMHPLYKKAYEEALRKLSREDEDFKKRLEKEYGIKAKNSASDDKFAYVMREFDEGKLKTPDGKVVTDPAQAKAIAYSESKKTENGLARARNAMAKNKKVKNSAVREYKHPDGRVAQIDFNEDGSDADMSIYDGSKEIEQRNFSTIRDAEQYVTSHGFRRI